MDKSLAMKLYNVMCETEALEKGLTVGKGTKGEYAAIGEKDVLNMVKPLFKKYKLIVRPIEGDITEIVNETIAYDKKGTRSITQLKVRFEITDAETGESTEIVGFGNGADSQDKGSGKAFTYAFKTALSKTFMLFSGEDTENHHSDEITNPKTSTEETKITTQQLIDIAKQKGFTVEALLKKHEKEHKKVTEVKFFKAEVKTDYYNQLSKLPDKENKE